jgi:glycosyltransferase involved in cell wall biosynthesis
MLKPEKRKVLILYNRLFHYRIPIFNIIGDHYDLTVAYTYGPDTTEKTTFSKVLLPAYSVKRFVIQKNNIYRLCLNFDVVVVFGDISWLKYSTLVFFKKRPFKLIFWSPGVSASYEKKYDAVSRWDSARDFFYRKADALIFYTIYPIKKYLNRGFSKEKLFVAPNTVEVFDTTDVSVVKDSILFIGTLYFEKGILVLLENYQRAYLENHDLLCLNIVGGGEELQRIKQWVAENQLEHKILVQGPVYDVKEKSVFFKRAFACISPIQAGLSVLESMGYGVPFITMNDAITGGERLNIEQDVTGILMNKTYELKDIILDIQNDKPRYIQMGKNAKIYYEKSHTPQHMANGVIDAIEFVSNH